MMTLFRGVVSLLVAALLAGCSSGGRHRPHSTDMSLEGETESIRRIMVRYGEEESERFSEPIGEIELQDAFDAAMAGNPALQMHSWEYRAWESEALQAALRPNPELAVELENFAGSGELGGFGGSETTFALSQVVELGGKRDKRSRLAQSAQGLAVSDFRIAQLELQRETATSFYEVLSAQEQLAVAEELFGVAEKMLVSVSRRVTAGSTSPVEEHLARAQVEISRIEVSQAERSLISARTQLSLNWGGSEAKFVRAVGDIEEIRSLPSLESLQGRVGRNPSVARWDAEREHHLATIEMERSLGTPDLSLGGGVRLYSGLDDAAFVAELGLPLPIFDRNRHEVEAARMRARRSESERTAATVAVLSRLSVSYDTVLAAQAEARSLRDRAIPEAKTAFELAEEAYSRGSIQFTYVLDTERQLFELKSRYFDALVRYHTAIAEVERLVGASIMRETNDSEGGQQ